MGKTIFRWHTATPEKVDIIDWPEPKSILHLSAYNAGENDVIIAAPSYGAPTQKLGYWDLNNNTGGHFGPTIATWHPPSKSLPFAGMLRAANGWIVPATYHAKNFYKIEISTRTVTRIGNSPVYNHLWHSSFPASNGLFYLHAQMNDNTKKIDPVANSVTGIGPSSIVNYVGGFEDSGTLYAFNANGGKCMEIDLATDTVTAYNVPNLSSCKEVIRSSANGNCYVIPRKNGKITKFDLATKTATQIGPAFANHPLPVEGLNKKIYITYPNTLLELNPLNDVVTQLTTTATHKDHQFYLASDGIGYNLKSANSRKLINTNL